MKTVAFISTLLLAALSTATAHAVPPVFSFQVRGDSGYGSAYTSDACQSIGVDFSGSAQTVHSAGGPPVEENGVWAGLWAYNWCTGAQTYGWAYVPGGYDGNMDSASIDVVFEAESWVWVVDGDGQWTYENLGTQTVEINAELTGIGQAIRGMNNSMSRWGSSFSRYRWLGQWREATVDASITIDGESLEVAGTYGSLGHANSGQTAIYE